MTEGRTTSGTIVMTDRLGIRYHICRIDYTVLENGEFEYVFTPDYGIIDILPDDFQGIPGLDLDLRREKYVRKNMHPVFISERTFGENRADKWELLQSVGMDYLDRLEWAIRAQRPYPGDNFSVARYDGEKKTLTFVNDRSGGMKFCRRILSSIAEGSTVVIDGARVDDANRKTICDTLRSLLRSELRLNNGKMGRGRTPKEIDYRDLTDARRMLTTGEKTADEIAKEMNIGRATLFRKLKKMDSF